MCLVTLDLGLDQENDAICRGLDRKWGNFGYILSLKIIVKKMYSAANQWSQTWLILIFFDNLFKESKGLLDPMKLFGSFDLFFLLGIIFVKQY